jgi:ubiquinone/menaquinone biosynthesis C-methylase UbiE
MEIHQCGSAMFEQGKLVAQTTNQPEQAAAQSIAAIVLAQFDDASFDLCVTYNGLHCLPDPRAALGELTRVLKPGGTLRGTSCVRVAVCARTP